MCQYNGLLAFYAKVMLSELIVQSNSTLVASLFGKKWSIVSIILKLKIRE